MKINFNLKIYYLIFLIFSIFSINAQTTEIWGVTTAGGEHNAGTIYKLNASGNAVVQHSFIVEENMPSTSLLLAPNGMMYGMTSEGGDKNMGILFEFDNTSNSFTKIIDFVGETNGSTPKSDLLLATNGKIYGITSSGGIYNKGTLFEFDVNTHVLTKKIDFDGVNNGETPLSGLIQATDGKFYGVTTKGGANDDGILYSYDINTNTITKLFDFDNATTGKAPRVKLLEATDGNLYGTTISGGNNNTGTIFKYDPNNNICMIANHFDNFGKVEDAFIEANDGKFYSINKTYSATAIFSFDPTTNAIDQLYSLNNSTNEKLVGGLLQSSNGKLYGAVRYSGTLGNGGVYSYDINTNSYSVEYASVFGNITGTPVKSLIEINNKLYGSMIYCGSRSSGIIYSYDITNQVFEKMYDFKGSEFGTNPLGGLMQMTNGKVFGTTNKGGTSNVGVIFEFDAETNTYHKVYDFNIVDGAEPLSKLTEGINGKLYGATYFGGANKMGVLFEFDPNTHVYTKMIDFNGSNGRNVLYTSLLSTSNGDLYGMTYRGGTNDKGVIYKYNILTHTFSVLHNFENATGRTTVGSLVKANNNKFYGLTKYGGANGKGVIFEFDPQTDFYTKLFDFDGTNTGAYPKGSLTEVVNGVFYGMTSRNGANQDGTLFEYNINTGVFTKKVDFDFNVTGGTPRVGDLLLTSDNLLYGTLLGGVNNMGTIIKFDYTADSFTKLYDFDNINGNYPFAGLTEIDTSLNIIEDNNIIGLVYPNPAKNAINIRLNIVSNNITLELLTLEGKIIESKEAGNAKTIHFNINQPAGVYLLRITDDKGNVSVTKVLKK